MKKMAFLVIAAGIILSALQAHAGICGSAERAWPADRDGSQRLTFTYKDGDMVELFQRDEEGVLVARGAIVTNNRARFVYAMYDLNNGYLVYALSKRAVKTKQVNGDFSDENPMQSDCNIQVFATQKSLNDQVKAALLQNQQSGCHAELLKLSQGRDYDQEKCGETITALNQVMTKLVRPDTHFKELTANEQIKKYIDKMRTRSKNLVTDVLFTDRNDPDGKRKDYCVGIETVDMKIISALRKPGTQKELATRKQMPSYLEEPRSYEKTTIQ